MVRSQMFSVEQPANHLGVAILGSCVQGVGHGVSDGEVCGPRSVVVARCARDEKHCPEMCGVDMLDLGKEVEGEFRWLQGGPQHHRHGRGLQTFFATVGMCNPGLGERT